MKKMTALKLAALAAWGCLLIGAVIAYGRSGIPIGKIPAALQDYIAGFGALGPAIFLTLIFFRPLTLLPVSIFCAAAGLLWGPVFGIIIMIIGDTLSAASAFFGARLLGRKWVADRDHPLLAGIDRLLEENGFMTVLILRLIFIPFDIVNFACGLTGMSFGTYAAGTFFGVLPGIFTFVLFGSGWNDPRNLAISAFIFVVSLGLAKYARSTRSGQAIAVTADSSGN